MADESGFDKDRFLAELHAHLVIVGMAHGNGHQGMADESAEEMLDSCRKNGVVVKMVGKTTETLGEWIDRMVQGGVRLEVSFDPEKKLQPGRG